MCSDLNLIDAARSQQRKELEEYLSNPKGIIVINQKLFKGLEAKNLIYLYANDRSYSGGSVRCPLMRAVSNLIMIELIHEDGRFFHFPRGEVLLDPSFLKLLFPQVL